MPWKRGHCSEPDEWQYGPASTKFRWNVSARTSVIPRYMSTAQTARIPRNSSLTFSTAGNWLGRISKGIPMALIQEMVGYGSPRGPFSFGKQCRRTSAWIFGRTDGLDFADLDQRSPITSKSDALFGTPIERLRHMNPWPSKLYQQNG